MAVWAATPGGLPGAAMEAIALQEPLECPDVSLSFLSWLGSFGYAARIMRTPTSSRTRKNSMTDDEKARFEALIKLRGFQTRLCVEGHPGRLGATGRLHVRREK